MEHWFHGRCTHVHSQHLCGRPAVLWLISPSSSDNSQDTRVNIIYNTWTKSLASSSVSNLGLNAWKLHGCAYTCDEDSIPGRCTKSPSVRHVTVLVRLSCWAGRWAYIVIVGPGTQHCKNLARLQWKMLPLHSQDLSLCGNHHLFLAQENHVKNRQLRNSEDFENELNQIASSQIGIMKACFMMGESHSFPNELY